MTRLHVALVTELALADFPCLDYFAESRCYGSIVSYAKTDPETRITNHLKRKVTPRRPKNADVRTREYLTEREVEQLIEGCKGNRRPHRDQTMILLAFRHGLRASEVCDLQWTQVDFEAATLAVTRAKHGTPS